MDFLADMIQPTRNRHKKCNGFHAEGGGLDTCDQCPFLKITEDGPFCNTSDEKLSYDENNKIPVPDWCGNKKS